MYAAKCRQGAAVYNTPKPTSLFGTSHVSSVTLSMGSERMSAYDRLAVTICRHHSNQTSRFSGQIQMKTKKNWQRCWKTWRMFG